MGSSGAGAQPKRRCSVDQSGALGAAGENIPCPAGLCASSALCPGVGGEEGDDVAMPNTSFLAGDDSICFSPCARALARDRAIARARSKTSLSSSLSSLHSSCSNALRSSRTPLIAAKSVLLSKVARPSCATVNNVVVVAVLFIFRILVSIEVGATATGDEATAGAAGAGAGAGTERITLHRRSRVRRLNS